MRIRFFKRALSEILEARAWYADESSEKEAAFLLAMEHVFERINQFPRSGILTASGQRWMQVGGFPYRLVYRLRAGDVVVVALPHDRQNPRRSQNR